MTDVKVISQKGVYGIDIDIINGQPVYLEQESMSSDQRAAISAFIIMGTIPGMPNVGADWSLLYGPDESEQLVNVDNQVKQNISEYGAGQEENSNSGKYYPMLMKGDEGYYVNIINTGEMK